MYCDEIEKLVPVEVGQMISLFVIIDETDDRRSNVKDFSV